MVVQQPQPEFDYSVSLEQIGEREFAVSANADAASREAVARRLEIPSVESLSFSARCKLIDRQRFLRITGQMHARVQVNCVVTLEPFEIELDEPLDLRFAVSRDLVKPGDVAPHEELELSEAEALLPEYVEDGRVNLGGLAVEALSLALPDYPRKPGVQLPPEVVAEEAADNVESLDSYRPFAKLAALKDKKE